MLADRCAPDDPRRRRRRRRPRAGRRTCSASEGYHVVTAADGPDGLRLAKEHRPLAITLDVLMPQMDGWAVLTSLKSDPELADIPVIMVTMTSDRHSATRSARPTS